MGQSSQSNQIIQNSDENKMNFVMSYKTANDLIYGQVPRNKSNLNINDSDNHPYQPETPVGIVKKEVSEIIPNYASVSTPLAVPEKKRELNSMNYISDLP